MRTRRPGTLLAIGALLTSCYQPLPRAEIDMGVWPRYGTWPSELHLLQIGAAAWRIGPDGGAGAVTWPTTEAQTVRLVRARDCSVLLSFEGLVGHRYNLIVGRDDQVTVEDVTQGAWENGPAIPRETDDPCLA